MGVSILLLYFRKGAIDRSSAQGYPGSRPNYGWHGAWEGGCARSTKSDKVMAGYESLKYHRACGTRVLFWGKGKQLRMEEGD